MAPSFTDTVRADRRGCVDCDKQLSVEHSSALKGARVVVTGGASGIGEACVRKLVQSRAYVVIADRNEALGSALEKDLKATYGDRVKYHTVEVTSWQSQLELFTSALTWFPGHILDHLITSAGVGSDSEWNVPSGNAEIKTLHNSSAQDRAALTKPSVAALDVNLQGTMFSAHIAMKYCMSDARSTEVNGLDKSIVLLGSTSGFRNLPGKVDYSIAKWGVRGLLRNLRSELPSRGIRINMMAPFWVPTAMTQHHVPALEKQGVRVGKLEDVVEGTVRMMTDRHMNGRVLTVTGKGLFDIADDLAGQDGGPAMSELVEAGWLSVPKTATL